ncbi:MAG: twitching motility protein PilT [Phycisphaerae bacterium]
MISASIPELEGWLEDTARLGGTDLLLLSGEPPTVRIAGRIQRLDADPLTATDTERIAAAALGSDRLAQLGPHAGVIYVTLRLSESTQATLCIARSDGRITLRARPAHSFVFEPRRIRVPEQVIQAVEAPGGGLVLVTGLPGSGKTTTCYSLLEHLNATQDIHMALLEYHAEYMFEPKRALIQRRNVGLDAPDMQSAIHSALVQDVDVLFIGELRDPESLASCLLAPEHGRRVITQLHQPAPESAIRRIVELQPDESAAAFRRLLARHLRAVLAQVILPRADGPGRVPAYGLLLPDDAMREAIVEGHDVLDGSRPLPEGCRTLAEDVAHLRDEGIITPEAARVALSTG